MKGNEKTRQTGGVPPVAFGLPRRIDIQLWHSRKNRSIRTADVCSDLMPGGLENAGSQRRSSKSYSNCRPGWDKLAVESQPLWPDAIGNRLLNPVRDFRARSSVFGMGASPMGWFRWGGFCRGWSGGPRSGSLSRQTCFAMRQLICKHARMYSRLLQKHRNIVTDNHGFGKLVFADMKWNACDIEKLSCCCLLFVRSQAEQSDQILMTLGTFMLRENMPRPKPCVRSRSSGEFGTNSGRGC